MARTNIHRFASTGDAYDMTQCSDNIKTGDLLVIESEKVVGFADTWPVAITKERGALHSIKDGRVVGYLTELGVTEAMLKSAIEMCRELGFPLVGDLEAYDG